MTGFFPYTAYCHLLFSVDTIISDGGFSVESCVAADILKGMQELCRWLKDSTNKILAEEFAKSIVCKLQHCIPDYGDFKTIKQRRECMWSNYHTVRCSTEYATAWNDFHPSKPSDTESSDLLAVHWRCHTEAAHQGELPYRQV